MPTSLYNRRRANVANQTPGYRNRFYVAATSQFTTIQEPTPGVGAAGQTVSVDHVFTGGAGTNGFYELYLLPKKAEASADSIGEPGALSQMHTFKAFLPGDDAATQALVKELQNEDLVGIAEDATCPGGPVLQYGCDCTPMNAKSAKLASGVVGGATTKGWEIEFECACRFFYTGTVEVHP